MRKKREVVRHIADWYSEHGYLKLDAENYTDFKTIYDSIYTLKVNTELEEEGIQLRINDLKYAEFPFEKYSLEQKNYLQLSIFILYLCNKGCFSVEGIYNICKGIWVTIQNSFEYYDMTNYDYIMIMVNAFRATWIECFEWESQFRGM